MTDLRWPNERIDEYVERRLKKYYEEYRTVIRYELKEAMLLVANDYEADRAHAPRQGMPIPAEALSEICVLAEKFLERHARSDDEYKPLNDVLAWLSAHPAPAEPAPPPVALDAPTQEPSASDSG